MKINIRFSTKNKSYFFISIILLISFGINYYEVNSAPITEENLEILSRFGITAPLGIVGYDLNTIHATSVLDWAAENNTIPEGIEYIHVLRLHDNVYAQMISSLPNLVSNNIGAVWLIGNEPDRYFFQDSISPEIYAERYFETATAIKLVDPTAKLGFGTVVQPTPIRIRYLERSLDRLIQLAGSSESAFALIDIWSIHAFILNEEAGVWGAGIPVGFDCAAGDCYDAVIINSENYADTYSIDIYKERIRNFRIWMNSIGEKEKPLWITEYGSLFPSISPDGKPIEVPGWPNDTDTIDFMINSFDYMLNAKDAAIGKGSDDNKLVQRWYWYSLNDHRYTFGGSLFDPDNNNQITEVGIAYKRYIENLINSKVYLPLVNK